MFGKEAALLEQITQSRESIRQKHMQLKHGLIDVQTNVAKVLQPVINPLNKIANKDTDKNDEKKKIYASTPHKKSFKLFDDDDDDNEWDKQS